MEFALVLFFCLLGAGLFGELCAAFKIPRVIGQIGAGVLLGLPALKSLLFTGESLRLLATFADFGVILLLFFTGLEINFRSFAKNLKVATGISVLNTSLPLAGGFLASRFLFGLSSEVSFLIGVCLSVTATALALDILDEFKLLSSKFGSLVVSAGAVDDVYELILITVSISFIESFTAGNALLVLLQNALIFAGLVFFFRVFIMPWSFKLLDDRSDTALFLCGLTATLLLAGLSSQLGFGALLGALISGILVRQFLLKSTSHKSWEAQHISKVVHTISFGFLVPIFFVHVGLQLNLADFFRNWEFGLVLSIIAITGTVIGCALACRWAGYSWNEGFLLGWALNGKGDTEIVIAELALSAGLISSAVFSSLIVVAVISTLVSPLMFRWLLVRSN